MRTRVITINGHELDQHDRRVITTWCGQDVGDVGDVCVEVHSKAHAKGLDELLDMLFPRELPPPQPNR